MKPIEGIPIASLLKTSDMAKHVRKTSEKHVHTVGKKQNTGKTNKLGVKNSLVNNINARKKKGSSRPKNKSTVSGKSYQEMENNWGHRS